MRESLAEWRADDPGALLDDAFDAIRGRHGKPTVTAKPTCHREALSLSPRSRSTDVFGWRNEADGLTPWTSALERGKKDTHCVGKKESTCIDKVDQTGGSSHGGETGSFGSK